MKRRRDSGSRGVAVLISLAVLMMFAAPLAAGSAAPAAQTDLYKIFGIEGVGADIVLAVDTSLSMKGDFGTVREALDGFSRALGPQDRLTIITFDNSARQVYRGPADRTARIRRAFPSAPDPGGQKTNIGEAVQLVLKKLDGKEQKLPVVVFLTDGLEDPPPQSEFALRPEAAWGRLTNHAAQQPNSKHAYVLGIGLNKETDIGRLQKIWPRAHPESIPPGELNARFKKLKEKIRQERLRREVKKELDTGGVSIEVAKENWGVMRPGTTRNQVLIVKSNYRKLPVEIDLSGLSWRRFRAAGEAGQPELKVKGGRFSLKPGQSRTVKVEVKAPEGERKLEIKKSEQGRGRLKVAVAAKTPVGSRIAELGIEPKIKTAGREREVHFTRSTGFSLYLLAVLALVTLMSVLVFGRYAATPAGQLVYRRLFAPSLFGRLAFSAVPAGEKLPQPVSLDRLGRKATLGTAGQIRLAGDDIKPIHAEILTGWEDGEPKMLIRPREGIVKVARSPASAPIVIAKETEIRAGGIVQIGAYRIQWS